MIEPKAPGWYLIKRKMDDNPSYSTKMRAEPTPFAVAYWFGNHFSLCGEWTKCVPNNVESWSEIKEQ